MEETGFEESNENRVEFELNFDLLSLAKCVLILRDILEDYSHYCSKIMTEVKTHELQWVSCYFWLLFWIPELQSTKLKS
jgi:hypothetical protein